MMHHVYYILHHLGVRRLSLLRSWARFPCLLASSGAGLFDTWLGSVTSERHATDEHRVDTETHAHDWRSNFAT